MVRRVTDCERLERVAVVISDRPEDEIVFDLVPRDVAVFVSQTPRRPGEGLRRDRSLPPRRRGVRAGGPAVHRSRLRRSARLDSVRASDVRLHQLQLRNGQPTILSPLGVFAEWCRATALVQADRAATAPADREEITRYLYSHPETFRLRLIPVPSELDRDDLRLTVEHEEDWEHLHTIYDALGPEGFEWRQIADLLHRNPDVLARMAHLNREVATR